MTRIRTAILLAASAAVYGAPSLADTSPEANQPGVTATCYMARVGPIGPPNIMQNMQRIETHNTRMRDLISKSPQRGKSQLDYVWGAVPVERKEGFNGRQWGQAYFIVSRSEFFGPTTCENGNYSFSSLEESVEWYIEYVNSRTKADPATRISSDWKEHVIRFSP